MTLTTDAFAPIAADFPAADAGVAEWIDWFWDVFFPAWIVRARDPEGAGFFDLLDETGSPSQIERRSTLALGRLLFTFSHIALLSDDPIYFEAARATREALKALRKGEGLYARAVSNTGGPTGKPEDAVAASYDQSFVILGLATWGRLNPDEDVSSEMEAVWTAVETVLHDPVTGMMLENDCVPDPAASDAPPRAQNPHMHLFEAALQAYEMTGARIWLSRAAKMRAKGLEYFFDVKSGTITEFLAPDLSILPGREGQWREIGHQCEWAWLLMREADLGGDPAARLVARRLLDFADRCGFAEDGPMKGAAFDAVACDESWREEKFLLWPQTEAIKAYAIHADDPEQAQKAKDLALLIFRRYFDGRAAYVNQLDAQGGVLWGEALSRLHYHLVLALTEGARAGLWRNPR